MHSASVLGVHRSSSFAPEHQHCRGYIGTGEKGNSRKAVSIRKHSYLLCMWGKEQSFNFSSAYFELVKDDIGTPIAQNPAIASKPGRASGHRNIHVLVLGLATCCYNCFHCQSLS